MDVTRCVAVFCYDSDVVVFDAVSAATAAVILQRDGVADRKQVSCSLQLFPDSGVPRILFLAYKFNYILAGDSL